MVDNLKTHWLLLKQLYLHFLYRRFLRPEVEIHQYSVYQFLDFYPRHRYSEKCSEKKSRDFRSHFGNQFQLSVMRRKYPSSNPFKLVKISFPTNQNPNTSEMGDLSPSKTFTYKICTNRQNQPRSVYFCCDPIQVT